MSISKPTKVQANLPYGKVYTEAQQQILRTLLLDPAPEFVTAEKATAHSPEGTMCNNWKTFSVDIGRWVAEMPDVDLTIKGEIGLNAVDIVQWMAQVDAERKAGQATEMNTVTNVVVPDLGVMSIRFVTVRTDYCTESLQDDLDNGWRLLAVCPQPARRPDYILGRATR